MSRSHGKPSFSSAGKQMPNPSPDEFFKFLQCQLRMEVREHTGEHLELPDKGAEEMWSDVEAFVMPNSVATERWVPYHTVLGVHELFLVKSVHSRKDWTEYQKFIAMFIFRAHCKCDVFTKAQLPHMREDSFWSDPRAAFDSGKVMETSILKYRKKTRAPLLTSAFRAIPNEGLADKDANLVRSITKRSMALVKIAEGAWKILKDRKKTSEHRIAAISNEIEKTPGFSETWALILGVEETYAVPNARE
jgi:hypothetical protein